MATITLSGTLPGASHNGLGALTDAILNGNPDGHMIVAAVSLSKTVSHSGGRITLTVAIDDIEACLLGTPGWDVARGLLDQRREDRTGETALPFEKTE
ncbi:hypothetical protein [Amycolatopsis dendrobii]|uniref:Uncharacterized protein n=1 Tax=Amycolatopsis dendrobii TaxID=2760662 RepID=A0A7W3VUL7_9PSEU|nr:hypothetical protein [Amycolatopsis dendrobii]MBB1153460.1 hypothetical protein [Amycolatopsis dendrobii]